MTPTALMALTAPIALITLTTGHISLTLIATTPFTPAVRLPAAKHQQVNLTTSLTLLQTNDQCLCLTAYFRLTWISQFSPYTKLLLYDVRYVCLHCVLATIVVFLIVCAIAFCCVVIVCN